MRFPFRSQVFWPHALLLVSVLGGVSVLNAYLAARQLERESIAHLRGIVDGLAGSNFPLTESVLSRMKHLAGVEFVLSNSAGKILGVSSTWPAADLDVLARSLSGDRAPSVITMDGLAYRHSAIAARHGMQDNSADVLHVLFPESRWRENWQRAVIPPLVAGLISILLVAILAWFIAARVSGPIQGLRIQLSKLAEGSFQKMDVPERDDEIRDLVQSANVTADSLQTLMKEVQIAERRSALGLLSAGLAHQVRNSATGARMALQLHERRFPSEDNEGLDVALRQLVLIEDYVGRFLDAGKSVEPKFAPVNPKEIWQDVQALVAPACRHRGVELRASIENWDHEPIDADRDQLRQLLLNLVLNALDAAGRDGWIRVEWIHQDGQVRLSVLDNGPGVSEDDAAHIFEPFVTRRPQGTGMGLAVARRIAEGHGGKLELTQRGGATCFTCELPIRVAI